jgi:hypothetical protein
MACNLKMRSPEYKQLIPTTLYAFLYNPMIHESGYITISIHRTREGAEKAMEWHKKESIEEDIENCGKHDPEWDSYKRWKVEEITIKD